MNIFRAVKATSESKPFITRECWGFGLKIFLTNSPDCCVIFSRAAKRPTRGWQPSKADLLAIDWIPTD